MDDASVSRYHHSDHSLSITTTVRIHSMRLLVLFVVSRPQHQYTKILTQGSSSGPYGRAGLLYGATLSAIALAPSRATVARQCQRRRTDVNDVERALTQRENNSELVVADVHTSITTLEIWGTL
jgi:hypothetical protein